MKLRALAALALVLVPSAANAAVVNFKATLNGDQVQPVVKTDSKGTADLDFDEATKELRGTIELDLAKGTKVTAQHLHRAKCGEAGSIVRNLTEPGANGLIAIDPSAPIKLDDDLAKALLDGELYINIRTEKKPAGEIRGQLYKDGSGKTCPQATGTPGGGDAGTSTPSGGNPNDPAAPESSSDDSGGGCAIGRSASGGPAAFGVFGIAIAAAGLLTAARRRRTR